MANRLRENDQVEPPEPRRTRGTTQPMATLSRPTPITQDEQHLGPTPSYYLTRWPQVNRVLEITEEKTGGKAGLLQRVFTYLMVGGFAAVVNLSFFALLLYKVSMPFNENVHYVVAYLIANEISIVANFIPNDRITFSHLPGHSRSWWTRCMRFHMTCIAGTLLTLAISFTLHALGVFGLLAQAIAIIIVLFFNFTFHHVFTYRHTAEEVL